MTYILFGCMFVMLIVIVRLSYIQVRTRYELKHMNNALNEVLDGKTQEYLMQFTDNRQVIDMIRTINSLLDDKKKIHADYQRSEESSRKMLANISHDIKTPLTVILGYLEMMQLKQQHQDEMLNKVEIKAEQVMEMIQKFFSLAKLEAGDTEISLTRVDISEICRENIVDFYSLLTEEGFEVNIQIPEDKLMVYGNEEALCRVLSNLITNAVRYGKAGKYLGINVYNDEKFAYVDVVDKGKGIPKEMINSVFDRLFTQEDSRNRKLGGSGLGLAIAKTLANKMEGDLAVTSEPDLKTVFTLQLKR